MKVDTYGIICCATGEIAMWLILELAKHLPGIPYIVCSLLIGFGVVTILMKLSKKVKKNDAK